MKFLAINWNEAHTTIVRLNTRTRRSKRMRRVLRAVGRKQFDLAMALMLRKPLVRCYDCKRKYAELTTWPDGSFIQSCLGCGTSLSGRIVPPIKIGPNVRPTREHIKPRKRHLKFVP